MMEATLLGRQTTKSTFTAAPAAVTVYEAPFGKTKLYIDAVGGTIGATAKAATLLGFKFNVKTGWRPQWGDGQDYFALPVYDGTTEIKCEMALRYNAIGEAVEDAMIAQTPQLYRIQLLGAALATPGTTYTYRTINIDFCGKVEEKPQLDDEDGLDIINVTVNAKYDRLATVFLNTCVITVVNEVAALV